MDQKTEDLKCADQEAIDQKYMREAIKQAKKAYALEEVPIGCVIVYDGKIIGRGYNRRTIDKNPRGACGDPRQSGKRDRKSGRRGGWKTAHCM